ncbi:amidase [Nocardia panacis]|uniref:Amidase n=1 Tax=Nocardia panacis TaxID=2340916 RepID=A0A3A4L813_9NOCA|nr:amidase [Nocardia panacis]RJO79181.1 amidase [Nocardia panacis]
MGTVMYKPWSLRELVADLRAGRTTPEQAFARSRNRIAGTAAELRAWVALLSEQGIPTGGPLGGIPLGVKDIIDLAGLPTKCGSALRAAAPPAEQDAAIVAAWRAAGAVPLGKTVSTEFAFFAPGPTRNPANPEHTPGGSSSGSAAAVASGQVPLALGTQTAGSVTRPAAYCGVAALVMSHARFPVDGVVGLSPSLDSHGVFAARVDDLAPAWSALTGSADAAAAQARPPRLLLWTPPVADDMGVALASAVATLRAAGATVDEFPLAELAAKVTAAQTIIMAYEAAIERAEELARADRISEQLAGLLRAGAETTTSEYESAREIVTAARASIADLRTDYDAIVGPAALGAAPVGLAKTGDPILSRPWQAMGLPVVAIPGLRNPAGLPLGLQLIGPDNELAALAAACWVENRLAEPT